MIGVLLVNLGTPDSPDPKDVYRYLMQFLRDPRIIDLPTLQRELFVRAVIVPFRYKTSAKCYKKIWTPEGSPLLVHTKNLQHALQNALGEDFKIEIGMRYGSPSIKSGLEALQSASRIIVLPLFPQYASATTGSVLQEVFNALQNWSFIPNVQTISSFWDHPLFIDSWAQIAKSYPLMDYDHIIFSYHGLPLSQMNASCGCLKPQCCDKITEKNALCYRAECIATTKLLVKQLQIPEKQYTISFQSRLGRKKWLEPYTTDVICERARRGDKKLLVFSPSFVSDCLETLYEIEIEAKEQFLSLGGTELKLVHSLNSHPSWVHALSTLIKNI